MPFSKPFAGPLKKAILRQRYKRFLADVVLQDGSETTIHIANTGAMTGCGSPGDTIWYSTSDNPKRKLPLSWELTELDGGDLICVNTARANQLVEQALRSGLIPQLADYSEFKREVAYGEENSKIDFLLSNEGLPDCYVEVKSVTLLDEEQGQQKGQGYFPDAKSLRGQKHLRELIQVAQSGQKAVLLFCLLHSGIETVDPAGHIDPVYAELFTEAKASGVDIIHFKPDLGHLISQAA